MKRIFPENLQNTSFCFHPNANNYHCLDWGPNGLLAVSFENFISIFDSSNFKVISTINFHKSNISCIRFSPGSVERSFTNSFLNLLAVGDEFGNCIIYDVINSQKIGGFSPEKQPSTPILDLQWNNSNVSMLFILTAAPSVICVSLGSTNRRRYSSVQSWSPVGQSIQAFNLNLVFSIPLTIKHQYILSDLFHTAQILVVSATGNYYSVIQLQNGRQPTTSNPLRFNGLPPNQKILSIECFPHNLNRLTIVLEHSIYVYDLMAKTASQIYHHELSTFAPMNNVFSASIANRFWIAISDGNVSSFLVKGEAFIREHNVLIPHFYQMRQFYVDPYKPSRFAACAADGKIAVFTEYKGKLICTSYYPSFPGTISSLTSDSDKKYSFITTQGYIGLFDTVTGEKYRFFIDSDKIEKSGFLLKTPSSSSRFHSICFVGKNLAIGGNCLIFIDVGNRQITIKNRNFTPSMLASFGSIIAYLPLPNTLQIAYPGKKNRTLCFKGNIVAFTARHSDPNLWAIVSKGSGVSIIDASESPKMVTQIPANDDAVSRILYIGSFVYVATRIGELIRINVDTKQSTSLKVCGRMIRTMRTFENFILISDVESFSYLVDTNDQQFRVIRAPKSKIYDVVFLTFKFDKDEMMRSREIENINNEDESDIKEKNVEEEEKFETVKPLSNLNENATQTLAVVQTSLSSLMIVSLPSFEINNFVMRNSITMSKKEGAETFSACRSVEKFESVALEMGDLDFVQFVRTVRCAGNLPLPALYTQRHIDFISKERMTRLIEMETQPNKLLDFFILCKQNKNAAELLLKIDSKNRDASAPAFNERINSSSVDQARTPPITHQDEEPNRESNNAPSEESTDKGNESGHVRKTSSAFFLPTLKTRKRVDSVSISPSANFLPFLINSNTEKAGDAAEQNVQETAAKKSGISFSFNKLMTFGGEPQLSNTPSSKSSSIAPSDNSHANESNLLLAYACLAPNLDAVRTIANMLTLNGASERHIYTIAKIFCIADDNIAAINWLASNNEWTMAFYYLKILYDDGQKIVYYLDDDDESMDFIRSVAMAESSANETNGADSANSNATENSNADESANKNATDTNADENSNNNNANENSNANENANKNATDTNADENSNNNNANNNANESEKVCSGGNKQRRKLIFSSDRIATEIIRSWMKQQTIQLSPLILVYIGDYHGALSLLLKTGSIAKAHALVLYLRENKIEPKPTSFVQFSSVPVDQVINQIEERWNSYA